MALTAVRGVAFRLVGCKWAIPPTLHRPPSWETDTDASARPNSGNCGVDPFFRQIAPQSRAVSPQLRGSLTPPDGNGEMMAFRPESRMDSQWPPIGRKKRAGHRVRTRLPCK